MKISVLLATVLSLTSATIQAADVLTPGFLKISLYTNIAGTAVSALTADPRYPASPSEVRFLRSFNTRDALPNDALENFGGRIEGFITPLVSGDYHFFLRSDDASELWLSTDDTETSAVLIAQETGCCGLFAEPGTDPATTAVPISLVAGQRYFIMVLYKSPGGGNNGQSTDYAQVAWRLLEDLTPATALQPIPGTFLSTLASDAQGPTITITQQPQNLTAEESARVTLSVAATSTPTNPTNRVIQWQRNGENIPGATGTNYSFFVTAADSGLPYRAVVSVPGAVAQSGDAIITVSPNDTRPPTIVGARGGPNRPEVTLTFSEPVSDISGVALENYAITGPGGPLTVTAAVLSGDRSQVLLSTDPQTPATVYTVQVNNVTDAAVAPNTIAPNSQVTFTARGPWQQGEDGFVVFEAEEYDRNLDGRWLQDTSRGTPSGGISMVLPNGIGGGEFGTRLEYDIMFTKTGTNILWFRSTANDGNDDSGFLHLDGVRPVERTGGNLAGMSTGSGLTADFTWRSVPVEGVGQMTFVVETPGLHTIGVARREDGSYFDKFLITIDSTFNPTTLFGPLGPPTTLRQGDSPPGGTSLEMTLQPTSIVIVEHSNVVLRAGVTTVPAASLVGYQWQRKEGNTFVDIPGATAPTFTITRAGLEWNGVVVRMRAASSGITRFSDEAQITVNPDVTPPSLLSASGLAPQRVVLRFSERLDPNSTTDPFAFEIQGPGGRLAVTSVTLQPSQRTIILETDPQTVGAKYTVTVTGLYDQAATSNLVVNAVARFYSLGVLREQGPDGLIVFEAENFHRNTDNRWITDSAWGDPSGGLSVVLPNGGGGSEAASKLEYDLTFTQTGTHYVWYRASGPGGNDDSAWLHLDGARPPNRAAANQAAMQCVNGTDFVWETDPQDGERPYTIDITSTGLHTIALAVREDGAYFDKFAITTDTNFNPNSFGLFGPDETREGVPPLAAITLTSPTNNQTFPAGANVSLAVAITDNGRVISKVEYFAGTQKIGESTNSPFSFNWQNVPEGVYAITALLTDDVGGTARSGRAIITVGNPNDVLFLAGSTTLNASDSAVRDLIAGLGFNVVVVDDDLSTDVDGIGKKLIVESSTVNSGSITTKFRNATAPVLTWEQSNQDDFGMTGDVDGTDRGTVPGQTQVEIVNPGHPMAAGFTGLITVATAATDFSWGLPNSNAVRIATLAGTPNRVVIYGYEAGTNMMGGFVAPARRVMVFLTDNTYAALNTVGRDLFAAAVNWALGGVTPPEIELTATRGPGGLTLQWTGGTGPYKVQKKNALTDASWSDVTTTSQTSHTVPLDGQSGFFRITQE